MPAFCTTSLSESAACRVASLLRGKPSTEEVNTSSLHHKVREIETFLTSAALSPPVRMETGLNEDLAAKGRDRDEGEERVVELSVVAGVFEEKPSLTGRQSGLLLPGEDTELELQRRSVEESKALLNLLGALAPSHAGSSNLPLVETHHGPCEKALKRSSEQTRDEDNISDVVVIYAEELDAEETTSDSSEDL
ncbi:unnamed protein product [Phytomonas sp. Hart1]|nr:unnamed protein product [Phytomonas sp. Hart1]|eukprot:CCW69842.1 unnamed protein product [Phytomonas sp. isolate Hart1]